MQEHDDHPIGVVIVDDQAMFGESLAGLISIERGIDVVGVARSGVEGLDVVDRHRPDVVLVDHRMPGEDGVSVAKEIKRRHPETMIVMVTADDDDRILAAAIEAGCSGFITKDRAVTDVVSAIHAAAAGEALISPTQLARLLPKLRPSNRPSSAELTDRERQLLVLLAGGGTNKAIAQELHLSVNTVRNYVQAILTKLGAHSKLEAVSIAVRDGVIDYPAS